MRAICLFEVIVSRSTLNKLRIFMAIPGSGTVKTSIKSSIWTRNLFEPLVRMGHEVILLDFDYDDYFVHAENIFWLKKNKSTLTDAIEKKFISENTKKRIDICFFYLCNEFIDYQVLDLIRKHGVPIFNYSCNNIHQFHLVDVISKKVDCNIFAEQNAKKKFDQIHVNSIQMQMGSNEFFYKDLGLQFQYDVTFVGQKYADRGDILMDLIDSEIDAYAFGPKWSEFQAIGNHSLKDMVDKIITITAKNGIQYTSHYLFNKIQKKFQDRSQASSLLGHVGGMLSDEQMVQVFNKSKINLGFTTVYLGGREGGVKLDHLRLRDFEIPMSGGFYLTKYSEEIENYFDVGREIECYSCQDDLIEKCKFYLKNSSAREKIRLAGLERSRNCHTWNKRFDKLFAAPKIQELIS